MERSSSGDWDDFQARAIGIITAATSSAVLNWLSSKNITTQVSVGGMGKSSFGGIDLLVPLFDNKKNLSFTEGEDGRSDQYADDYRNTLNVGFGYRHTTSRFILGTNAFYDRDLRVNNDRLGLGLEAMANYVKLSANGYMRLSDWSRSQDHKELRERAANGWDLRARAYLPSYPQLGLNLMHEQYYGDEISLFWVSRRQQDPKATTVALSYTPVPLFSFGADHKRGSDGLVETSFKIGMNLQLGVDLAKQLDPHSIIASRLLSDARFDFVDRNNQIVMDYLHDDVGMIMLPPKLSATTGSSVNFPVALTSSKVKNVSWIGSGARYILPYNGTGTGTAVMPEFIPGHLNSYTVQAVGSDSIGRVVKSSMMTIGVHSILVDFDLSKATAKSDGVDAVEVKAIFRDESGEPMENRSVSWEISGNYSSLTRDRETDKSGIARLKLVSNESGEISIKVVDTRSGGVFIKSVRFL